MTGCIASKCFAAILVLIVACCAIADSAGISSPQTDISTLVQYLNPALAEGTPMRLSYSASCLATSYAGDLLVAGHPVDVPPMPAIRVSAPSSRLTGIAAVRSVFESDRNVTVMKGPDDIVTISVGKVPANILETRVVLRKLQPIEQYNPGEVIDALESTKELNNAVKSSGLLLVRPIHLELLYQPVPGDSAPHVPAVLHDVSIDQVLDMVVRTFGGVVTYGVCTGGPAPRLLFINYIHTPQ